MIIGVSGFSKAGKSEVARRLVEAHGAVEVALADEIKRTCMRIFSFTEEQLWGADKEKPDERYLREHTWNESGKCVCCGTSRTLYDNFVEPCFLTPRYAMQKIGTEMTRDCYPNVWIENAVRVANALRFGDWKYDSSLGLRYSPGRRGVPVVVPDLRFKNEIDGLRGAGAKLVRVRRVGYEKPRFDHPSETEQMGIGDSEFDHVIENDSDLAALASKVDQMWKELSR